MMKKIVLIIFFLFLIAVPFFALAQSPGGSAMFSVPNPLPSFHSIQGAVRAIIDIAFSAAGLVAVAFLITGGYRYITSQGNPEQVEAAKATISNAVIGLIVIFISFLLVNYILLSLHVGPLYQLGSASPS